MSFIKKCYEKLWCSNRQFFGGALDGKIIKLPRNQHRYKYQKPNLSLASYLGKDLNRSRSYTEVVYDRWRIVPWWGGKYCYVFVPSQLTYYEIKELLFFRGLINHQIHYWY